MTPRIDRREFLIASGASVALSTLGTPARASGGSGLRVAGLRADNVDNPLGLENRQPRLSWRLESTRRGARQGAYRILVASTESRLRAGRADLWDSGRIESQRSIGVCYEGVPLTSRQRCWWTVEVWDQRGLASDPGVVSWWEMGLLESADWTASWLAAEDAV